MNIPGAAHRYTEFHLNHITTNYDECKRSAALHSLRACLSRNKYALPHLHTFLEEGNAPSASSPSQQRFMLGTCCFHRWLLLTTSCLTKSPLPHRKQLRHSDIMWFDEAFLAVLQERLGDVRSIFGFGSGRGDFERYFFEQVCILPNSYNSTCNEVLRFSRLGEPV